MKEIVKKVDKTFYQASDGTEFENRTECEKYERSAKGVLMDQYHKMVLVSEISEDKLFCNNNEDNYVDVIKISNPHEADVVKQLVLLYNEYIVNNKEDIKRECFEMIDEVLNSDENYLIISRGFDSDCFYPLTTKQRILKCLNLIFD